MEDVANPLPMVAYPQNSEEFYGVRCRGWCLTIPNPTQEHVQKLAQYQHQTDCYIIFQEETNKSGQPQLKCFVHYDNVRSWPKKAFPWAKIKVGRGTTKCIARCMRDHRRIEGPYEFGINPIKIRKGTISNVKPGKLTIAQELALDPNYPFPDIAASYPAIYKRYWKYLWNLRTSALTPRTTSPHVVWIWGGEIHEMEQYALSLTENMTVYIKDATKWWDYYQHQDAVIITGFEELNFHYHELCKLLGNSTCRLKMRGGTTEMRSTYVVIVCQRHPSQIWSGKRLQNILPLITEHVQLNMLDILEASNNDKKCDMSPPPLPHELILESAPEEQEGTFNIFTYTGPSVLDELGPLQY